VKNVKKIGLCIICRGFCRF